MNLICPFCNLPLNSSRPNDWICTQFNGTNDSQIPNHFVWIRIIHNKPEYYISHLNIGEGRFSLDYNNDRFLIGDVINNIWLRPPNFGYIDLDQDLKIQFDIILDKVKNFLLLV